MHNAPTHMGLVRLVSIHVISLIELKISQDNGK